jgi:UDP-N-acetylmuramate: L-alanyl-gamma-D-glutamyl-meso-diaminopimelate ligase
MERTATIGDIAIYDDFAHHPTAIRRSLAGLRRRYPNRRIVIALDPRSNTMKLGIHNDTLGESLAAADLAFIYRPTGIGPAFETGLAQLGGRATLYDDYDSLAAGVVDNTRAGDLLVFMSNGGFGGVRHKVTSALQGVLPAGQDPSPVPRPILE